MDHENEMIPSSGSDEHLGDHEAGAALRRIAWSAAEPSRALIGEALICRVPELAALAGVPQDSRWHPEGDVLTHSLLAVDAAAKLWSTRPGSTARRGIVVLAALFHDVGKPDTTRSSEAFVASPGHAELGERIMLRAGARLGWPIGDVRAVAALVRHHMAPVSVQGDPTPKAVRRLQKRLAAAGTSLEEWWIVVNADGSARGVASDPTRGESWLRVRSRTSRSPPATE